jgi:hypothetical protein
MFPPRLFIAMTVVVSSSCHSSYRVVPLFSQRKLPSSLSSLLGFVPQRRHVRLPSRKLFEQPRASEETSISSQTKSGSSVTGPIYLMEGVPTVKLFTKQGCTLCDRVKDVSTFVAVEINRIHHFSICCCYVTLFYFLVDKALESVREVQPHSLIQVDITDDDKQEWFSKYK